MIPSPWTRRRLLIPRWRSLPLTITTNELAMTYPAEASNYAPLCSLDLHKKVVPWKLNPSVITAGELVGTTLVEAQESKAVEAAQYLLSTDSSATASLRHLATLALKRAGLPGLSAIPTGISSPRAEKQKWRQRTRMYPANALAWVELSLHDVIAGRKKAAARSMIVALQLAPTNRHVLRSASRLFLHLDDAERAYDIIAKCDAIGSDPWLMAAELSIAKLAGRKPKYFAQGRRIVENGGLIPRQITELAGAIGTLELGAGRRRKARDYFRQSVVDPTGNALAQAEWASPLFGFKLVTKQHLTAVPEADEAKVFQLLHEESFSKVPDVCRRWMRTEKYAIRPYEIASSATSVIGDHKRTHDIAKEGLMIRPKAGILLNNYAFALTHLGQLNKAEQALRGVQYDNETTWLIKRSKPRAFSYAAR